jgi:predicted nucleotidyltransferase
LPNVAKDKGQFAGVLMTQKMNAKQLQTLTVSANAKHMVVFSPFEGDVERGVQSGIAVEARVRPYLNTKALRNAQVRLKPFFMKVAKAYEE